MVLKFLLVKLLIVHSAQVVVMKCNMPEFGAKDVKFAAVFKNDFVIEAEESFLG